AAADRDRPAARARGRTSPELAGDRGARGRAAPRGALTHRRPAIPRGRALVSDPQHVNATDPADAGFETRAIHAGQPPDPSTGAVVTPVTLATTFAQRAVGEHQGYEYSRSGNPTRSALEACLASLEGARHGMAFASGLAASDAVLRQ